MNGIPKLPEVNSAERPQCGSTEPLFLPISLKTPRVEIELPNGGVVRLPGDVKRSVLTAVVRVVGSMFLNDREGINRLMLPMRLMSWQTAKEAIAECHEGKALTDWTSGLAFRRLLETFVSVCNVVAFAHHKGVLHRDIKPDNIMLGPYHGQRELSCRPVG